MPATNTQQRTSGEQVRRDLFISLALLGFIGLIAVGGLAHDGNWRKVLRVSLAVLCYSSLLLIFVRLLPRAAVTESGLAFWVFACAAGIAELASGWLRPDWSISDTLVLPLAAAALVGGFHWFVLRTWRPLRQRLTKNQIPT